MGCKINLFPKYYRPYDLASIGQCLQGFLHLSPQQIFQLWRRCYIIDLFTLIICFGPYTLLRSSTNSLVPHKYFGGEVFPWNPTVYKSRYHQTSKMDAILDGEKSIYDLSIKKCGISYTEEFYEVWHDDLKPSLERVHRYFVAACVTNMISFFPAVIFKFNLYYIEMIRLGFVTIFQIITALLGITAGSLLATTNLCIYDILPTMWLHTWACCALFLHFILMKIIIMAITFWYWRVETKRKEMWQKLKTDCISEFQKVDKMYYSKMFCEKVFPSDCSWGPEFMVIGTYFNIHMARFLGRLPPSKKRTRKEGKTMMQELFDSLYPKPKRFFRSNWKPTEEQETVHVGYWPDKKYAKHHVLVKWGEEDKNLEKNKNKITDKKKPRRKPRRSLPRETGKKVTIVESSLAKKSWDNLIPNARSRIDNDDLVSESEMPNEHLGTSKSDQFSTTDARMSGSEGFKRRKESLLASSTRKRKIRKSKGKKIRKLAKHASGVFHFLVHLKKSIVVKARHLFSKFKKCCCCRILKRFLKRIRRWKRKLHREFLKLFAWSRFVHYRIQWFIPGSKRHHFWGRRPRDIFFKSVKVVNGKIVPIVDYHLWGKRPKGLWQKMPKKVKRQEKPLRIVESKPKAHKFFELNEVEPSVQSVFARDITGRSLFEKDISGRRSVFEKSFRRRSTLGNAFKRRSTFEKGKRSTFEKDMRKKLKEPLDVFSTEVTSENPKRKYEGKRRGQFDRETYATISKGDISLSKKHQAKIKDERRRLQQKRKWEFMVRHKILDPVRKRKYEAKDAFLGRQFIWQLEALRLRKEQRRRRRKRIRRYIRTRFKKRRLKDAARSLYISPLIQVFHAPPSVYIPRERLGSIRAEMLQSHGNFHLDENYRVIIPELGEEGIEIPSFDSEAPKRKNFLRDKVYQRPGYTYIPSRTVGRDGQWVPDVNIDAVTQIKPRVLEVPEKWKPKQWPLPRITLQRPSDEFGNLPPVEVLFDPVTHPHIDLTHTELKVVFHVENNPRNYFRTYKGDLDKELYIKKKRLLITEQRDYTFYKNFIKKTRRWRRAPDKYRKLYPGIYWDRILYDQTEEVPERIFWSKTFGRTLSKLWDLRWGKKVKKGEKLSDHKIKTETKKVVEKEQLVREPPSRKAVNLFQSYLFDTPLDLSERQKIIQRTPSIIRPRTRTAKRNQPEGSTRRYHRDKKGRHPLRPYFTIPVDLPPSLLTDPNPFAPAKNAEPTQSTVLIPSQSQTITSFRFTQERLRRTLARAQMNLQSRTDKGSITNIKMPGKSASSASIVSFKPKSVSQHANLTTQEVSGAPPKRYGSHLTILPDSKKGNKSSIKLPNLPSRSVSKLQDVKVTRQSIKEPQANPKQQQRHSHFTLTEFASKPPTELYHDLHFSLFKQNSDASKQDKKHETGNQQRGLNKKEDSNAMSTRRDRDAERNKDIVTRERQNNVPLSIVNNYRAGRLRNIMIREARRIFVHKLTNFRRRFLTEQRIELIKRGYSLTTILKWQEEYYLDKSKLPGHLHGYKFKYATFN